MKDLIKEIEKQKINRFKSFEEDSWNSALDKVIKIINQYNIITAPKSIKLSEIVSRLNDCKFDRYSDYISLSRHYTFLVIKNNKIIIDELPQTDEFKWLYTLWIAGTEIIDDLEVLEKC